MDTSDPPSLAGIGPGQIGRVMDLARRHLGMDVAYVAAFDDGVQRYRALSGDGASFGMEVGSGHPLDTTYCVRMVGDPAYSVIPDAAVDARVSDLPITADARIGAYIGVPLRLPDGSLYGTFCCLSHEADPTLSERDARFLRMLAEMLSDDVAAIHEREQARRLIRSLLDERAVSIALQPVVDLADNRVVGMEALSRFKPPAPPPDLTFALAHNSGLGLDLERLAVESALALLPSIAPTQFLAINVGPEVAIRLAGLVTPDVDVAFDRLVLEVTEHSAVESYSDLREALRPLRDRGLRVAIDDAGAGFASLHHVVELRPDIIKVDRSLIGGISQDPVRRSVVASFVQLGHEIDALVLAEGVETEQDLWVVKGLGVGAAQGYLFARPSTDPVQHARWAAQAGM